MAEQKTLMEKLSEYHNLGVDRNNYKSFYVEEIDETIYIKPVTLDDEKNYGKELDTREYAGFVKMLTSRCLNQSGHPLFARDDAKKIGKTSFTLVVKICGEINRIDKEYEDDRKEAVEVLKKTRASSTVSTLPNSSIAE